MDILIRSLLVLFVVGSVSMAWMNNKNIETKDAKYASMVMEFEGKVASVSAQLEELKNEDPYKTNTELQEKITKTEEAYGEVGAVFDQRAEMESEGYKTGDVDVELAVLLSHLSKLEYEEAVTLSNELQSSMNAIVAAAVAKANPVATAPESNALPGGGYSRQTVSTERGSFTVAMVVASGATVVIDTAGDSDCSNECPTLSLADYVSRNGGFAGINGGYFCPPDYASCQGKTNTFDTLVFNGRTKTAFNQSNNVYSVVPLIAAYGSSLNFYGRTLDWGVDSGATGALANYPLLLSGNNIAFDEGSTPAYLRDNKGTRGFIGTKDGNIVIGHIFGANVMDAAIVLKTLGLQDALNLDGGGSSALWSGGYKVGPGRSLPVAIVLK